MSSPPLDTSSREANRSSNNIQESQLPQNRNPSEMDTIEDLTRKLHQAEKQNVELINQRNREMSRYEKEIMKLRLELEREEVLRQGLQSEISFARKQACIQMYSAEDELCDVKTKLVELQVLNDKHQQKAAEAEKLFQSVQWKWEEEQQRFSRERNDIRRLYFAEMEFLIKEKSETEKASQETNAALQNMHRILRDIEIEHNGCSEMLRLQANHLDFKSKRQERLLRELEAATVKTKKLQENAEAERVAHLQCKYTTEIMQLRIQELEDALSAEKGGRTEALSVVANTRKDFRESENAHGSEKNVLQRQHMQGREGTEEKDIGDSCGRLVDAGTSLSLQEGPVEQLPILLNLYQSMADSHVLAIQPDGPLEELSATEFCALLHENIEALIMNFHKANERISHLEYICKHKTDTMNDLQQNQEDAFEKMSEQLKAQDHCWQKEKQYLEQQYSNLLAEAHARAQECEETAQKNRQKLYGLEQVCEKLVHENASVRNTLANAQKERSSLLAACALLSGALCPLYGRMCEMSSQRDLLQDQVNLHDLVNQKIGSLLCVLPTNKDNNQDEARLRQRRAKGLVYVFRRAVIAVLAANRLRHLAQYSHSLFIWTDGSRGSTGIRVCVGESGGRHNKLRFEEEEVDCIEALDWLTSSNLYTAIISSVSELQDVLNKPDPKSWLSGHSLISAARNSFAKLMDHLSILMETVQVNPCRCTAYLERDSLMQRLACGLHRVNAQALEVGLYDRLPTTRNIAILQQEVFEFSRRLHTAEVECRSLHLQLAEFKWTLNEMQKEADKAHRLQEQLNALQHKIITQDNIHEELENALQREHEARLLLQEHERRLRELSNRLEVHTTADTDKSQDLNVSLKSLSEASEELRRRDRVLNHQKRLLKDMEQDRQRLLDCLQEAERDLQKAAKDKEWLINRMKAVHATLTEVGNRFGSSGYAASTSQSYLLLPSLHLKTLSKEEMAGRPEARAFQNVLVSFMCLYETASTYVKILTLGRDTYRIRFPSQAAGTPPAPAHDDVFLPYISPQGAGTSPAPAHHESFPVRFETQAAGTPRGPARDASFQVHFEPQAAGTSPAPAPARDESFRPRLELQAAGAPPAPAHDESFRVHFEPKAAGTPPAPARDESFWLPVLPQAAHPTPAPAHSRHESFWHRIGQQLDRTPPAHARESDEPFQPQFVPRGAAAPPGPETDDIFRPRFEPKAAGAPPAPAHDESFRPHFGPQGAAAPRDIFKPYVSPQAAGTPRGPAHDEFFWPLFGLQRATSPRGRETYEPSLLHFVPRGTSTPRGPAHDESFRPRFGPQGAAAPHGHETYKPSLLHFVPQGTSTPRAPAHDAHGRGPRHQRFSFRPESQLDQSYSQDFRALPAETDIFSNVIPHGTYTVSAPNVHSSVTPSKIGTGSSMDISSGLIPYRSYTMSATSVPSRVTHGRAGPRSSTNKSSGAISCRTYTVSANNIPSSVTPSRTDMGSSMDISSGEMPYGTYTVSSVNTPSKVIPIRTDTGSSMDDSSSIVRNTTFTMPSNLTGKGTGTGSSVNTSFIFRPRRTSSLPSVRTFSPGVLSSTRRNQEI